MGTQQILLIVLSVIIVGIAVAVGITMFNQQAFNSNRSACISDMNMFAQQAQAWFKTPATHGGVGSRDVAAGDLDALVDWIGFTDNVTGDNELATGNGQFDLAISAGNVLTITATGNEPSVDPQLVLDFDTGDAQVTIDTAS